MDRFFLITLFIGTVLMGTAIVIALSDKRNSYNYALKLEEEKKELMKAIETSEEMLVELNRISGYVTDQIEEKTDKLKDILKNAENHQAGPAVLKDKKLDAAADEFIYISYGNELDGDGDINEENIPKKKGISQADIKAINKISQGVKGPQSHSSKSFEVLELFKKGYSDLDIARTLKIGKGEVQLILGMYGDKTVM